MSESSLMIISGGQTGVDRAALDVALHYKIPCGGWCPKSREAEDGPIPAKYPLKETDSENPEIRTAKNVEDSEATLIIHDGQFDSGTAFTLTQCIIQNKPMLEIDVSEPYHIDSIREWLAEHDVLELNVAGTRESEAPGIYKQAKKLLEMLLPKDLHIND